MIVNSNNHVMPGLTDDWIGRVRKLEAVLDSKRSGAKFAGQEGDLSPLFGSLVRSRLYSS